MKAKEYYAKHFGDLEIKEDLTAEGFFNAVVDCYTEFTTEAQAAIRSVEKQQSKVSKIKEYDKKWGAVGDLVSKGFRPCLEKGVLTLNDLVVVRSFNRTFMKENFPVLTSVIFGE